MIEDMKRYNRPQRLLAVELSLDRLSNHSKECEASFPLGMMLGQDTEQQGAMIVVDEVLPDSNGALVGIQEGCVLEPVCTSCKVEVEHEIGRLKTMRFMLGTDDKPLELVLEALRAKSNGSQSTAGGLGG